jgi:outer membrane protein assembly factor BamB
MRHSAFRAAGLGLAGCLLAGCSSIPFLGDDGDGNDEAIENAGRIDMVLGDEALAADPDLIDVSVTLPPPAPLAAWPQTGAGAQKVPGHILAGDALSVAWSRNAGEGTGRFQAVTAPPVTSETAIFVIDASQTVRAFSLSGGAELWENEIESGSRRDKLVNGGGIGYDSERVFVGSGFGLVVAMDAETGAEIWRRQFDSPMIGSPTIRDGRVFILSNNNEIFALNADTGETEWSDQAISESARVLGSPSPAAVEDIVVVPFSSGEVITFLASNGRRLWSDALTRSGRFTPISAINDISARPVLASGLVFASSQSGVTVALDGRSGSRVWSQAIGSIGAPALAGQFVFVMGVDGQIAALLGETGQVVWAEQLPQFENEEKKKGKISYRGPLLASGRIIVVSSEGELIALSPQTGEEVARLDLRERVFIEPIAADGKIFVLTDDARLIAIE